MSEKTICGVIRMNPDPTQGQLEPLATNSFRLEPLLRHLTYPMPSWHNLLDKEVLRTFVAPPFITDKVILLFQSFQACHVCVAAFKPFC